MKTNHLLHSMIVLVSAAPDTVVDVVADGASGRVRARARMILQVVK